MYYDHGSFTPNSLNFDPHFNPHNNLGAEPPSWIRLITTLLNLVSLMYLVHCLTVRWSSWSGNLKSIPIVNWFVFIVYNSSLGFILSSMIVKYAYGLSSSASACEAGVMICLTFYLVSKLLIYFYFTERSFIVWGGRGGQRLRNKLYLFNVVVIIGGYIAVIVLTYIYRISYIAPSGFCLIGIQTHVSIVLVVYESAINIYLTFLFLYPFRKLYHSTVLNQNSKQNPQLRQMTVRCLVGTFGTCLSTGANLTAVAILDGQQAWLCLTCCNMDLFLCVVILHWVTAYGINSPKSPAAQYDQADVYLDGYNANGAAPSPNKEEMGIGSPRTAESPPIRSPTKSKFGSNPDFMDMGLQTTVEHVEGQRDPPPSMGISVSTRQRVEYEAVNFSRGGRANNIVSNGSSFPSPTIDRGSWRY